MSRQLSLPGIGSVISSRASASGLLPSGLPASPRIARSGLALVPVSLSARQAAEMGLLTSGTYGQHGIGSSSSVALSSSLASRLRMATGSLGSTLYRLTWTARATPLGWSIPARRALGPRTSGSGSTGWPTPTTRDWKDGSECSNVPLNALLGREVQLAGWPTPREADGEKNVRTLEGSLSEIARKGSPQDLAQAAAICGPARLTASGEMLTGSSAGMPAGGQLRPEFALWLILGPYATEWARCAEQVTRFASRKPLRSSKP